MEDLYNHPDRDSDKVNVWRLYKLTNFHAQQYYFFTDHAKSRALLAKTYRFETKY